ncbi:uncharacterized protein LOC135501359 [Lineus longissimus]|uniref:uncharacterized protein LOC135501359 n=1 Tax=Lineus longissimus TaxID=88925 RepID=UPI00315E0144
MPSLCDAGSSPFAFATPAPVKKAKVNKKPPPPKMDSSSEDEDYLLSGSEDEDNDSESDYYPTPIKRKPRNRRETNAHEGEEEMSKIRKTSSKARMCMCKTGCNTKRCSCRTGLAFCSEACGCIGCKNVEEIQPDSTMGIDKESDSILESTTSTIMEESKVELNTTFCIDDKSPAVTNKTEKASPKKLFGDSSNQADSPLEFKETALVTSLFPRKKKSSENNGPVAKRKRQLLSQGERFFPGLSD